MQNAAQDSVSVQSDGGTDSYRSTISELVSLVAHVQASMVLIESPHGGGSHRQTIVLDDVTPRYAEASAAL